MVNSINSNIAAYFAQSNISIAANNSASSVARLSSGDRIVKSSDDVAALSIGTSLQTGVSTLKVALTNASQGTSLLQVADGALTQITSILQRQKAIALQAASGSLTNTDRGFLDQEFQSLSAEIDRLASSTTFNGVKLINGDLSSGTIAKSSTQQATAGTGTLTIVDNQSLTDGSIFKINGLSITAKDTPTLETQFQIGATAAQTIQSLATKLNELATSGTSAQQLALGGAVYSANGGTLTVTARSGGALDSTFKLDVSAANTTSGSKVASVGGQFGGAKLNLFATGFDSKTASIVAATTATAEIPFVDGAAITFNTGNGATQTLVEVIEDDSLVTIADAINANTSTTGVTAKVITTSAGVYNIELSFDNAASTDYISLSGGDNYFQSTTSSSTATTSNVTHAINSATASKALFSSAVTAGATIIGATQGTGNVIFDEDDKLFVVVSDGTNAFADESYIEIADFTGLTTVQSLVDAINANTNDAAKALGIRAELTSSGTNINIIYNDSTQTNKVGFLVANAVDEDGVITGTGSYNVGAGVGSNLNTGYTQKSLFQTALSNGTGTTVVASANAATAADGTTTFFRAGSTMQVTIDGLNDGNAINIGTVGDGDDLNDLITSINASAGAKAYGIKASLTITAGDGNDANIILTVQDVLGNGEAFSSVAFSGGANYVAGTNGVITANGTNTFVAAGSTTYADTTVTRNSVYALSGGADDGLGQGSTTIIGTVGDDVLVGLSQTKASTTLTFPSLTDSQLTESGNFNSDGSVYLQVGDQKFYFVTDATLADEIQIGSSLKETLDNAISSIAQFAKDDATGDVAYQLSQVDITRQGNSLVFTGKNLSNVTKLDGSTAVQVQLLGGFQGSSVTNSGNLNNASNGTTPSFGVDATGISNAAFAGKISGFTASYSSANTVTLSVKVGDYTYSAAGVSTNGTANSTIRLYSSEADDGTNGGYFDLQLAANNGSAVSDADSAQDFADRVSSAFGSLTFLQERAVSSYKPAGSIVVNNTVVGSLLGSKVSAQLPDFSALKLSDVKVLAPSGSSLDASVSVTINGVAYKSASGLGSSLGANQTIRLTSEADSNYYLDFTTGNSSIDLSSAANAKAVQDALGSAFGINDGSAALTFQIGAASSDTLAVNLGSAQTENLFNGATLNVLTKDGAEAASAALDIALGSVTSLRATVGALQSRFNFASANIQTSVQNQDAARGALLDTDIAIESTNYATSQVKLQAGISVLAQANQQLQALLKLIGS